MLTWRGVAQADELAGAVATFLSNNVDGDIDMFAQVPPPLHHLPPPLATLLPAPPPPAPPPRPATSSLYSIGTRTGMVGEVGHVVCGEVARVVSDVSICACQVI